MTGKNRMNRIIPLFVLIKPRDVKNHEQVRKYSIETLSYAKSIVDIQMKKDVSLLNNISFTSSISDFRAWINAISTYAESAFLLDTVAPCKIHNIKACFISKYVRMIFDNTRFYTSLQIYEMARAAREVSHTYIIITNTISFCPF